MELRFLPDPETGLPHIHDHGVTEQEVREVLEGSAERRAGKRNSMIALGRTATGRYLRVVYVVDPEPDSLFVITAYDLAGKPLKAFRRRQRRRRQ